MSAFVSSRFASNCRVDGAHRSIIGNAHRSFLKEIPGFITNVTFAPLVYHMWQAVSCRRGACLREVRAVPCIVWCLVPGLCELSVTCCLPFARRRSPLVFWEGLRWCFVGAFEYESDANPDRAMARA